MPYQPKVSSGSQTTVPSIVDVARRYFGVRLYRPGEGYVPPPLPGTDPYAIPTSDQTPHEMSNQARNTDSQQTNSAYSPAPNEIVYVCNICYYNRDFQRLDDTLVILSPAQAEMYFSNKSDFLYNCARTFIACGVILLELSEPIAATMEEFMPRLDSYEQMIKTFEMEKNNSRMVAAQSDEDYPASTPGQVPTQASPRQEQEPYQSLPQMQDQEPVQTPVSPVPFGIDEDDTVDSDSQAYISGTTERTPDKNALASEKNCLLARIAEIDALLETCA